MSASNAYRPSVISFTFPDDPFYGLVNDPTGAVVYQLDLEKGLLGGKKASSISRIGPKGSFQPVGEINRGGLTSSKNVIVSGIDCVATYTRRMTRLLHSNIPASLSVDQSYSAPVVLDFIVVSALMMEKKREDKEKSRRNAAVNGASASAASSGGGGGGGC